MLVVPCLVAALVAITLGRLVLAIAFVCFAACDYLGERHDLERRRAK